MFERAIIVERVIAGIAWSKARGTKSGKGGQAPLTHDQEVALRLPRVGASVHATALAAGICVGAVAALKK
jgi:hypothetical protein